MEDGELGPSEHLSHDHPLSFHLFVAQVTITLTAIVVVATKGNVSPAIAGLALASIFQVSSSKNISLRFFTPLIQLGRCAPSFHL